MTIYVSLNQIDDNPFQARQEYGDVAELAADIIRHSVDRPDTLGLQQIPTGRLVGDDGYLVPTARLDPGEYLDGNQLRPGWRIQLEFGHRRLRAFQYLNKNGAHEYGRMPVILRDLSDEQMIDGVWSENAARKNLSAVEEAQLLARKLDQVKAAGGSQRDVAEAWGLGRSTVANKLRLLQLPDQLQQANREGLVSERVCGDMLRVVEIQTAINGSDWKKLKDSYYRPHAPETFIAEVLAKPGKMTSDDVREYVKSALGYAGEPLPGAVAKHPVYGDVRQETCKGCPMRINQHCLDRPCIAAKQAQFAEDMVYQVAEELEIPVSFINEDFLPAKHEWNTREAITAAWENREAYPSVDFVAGWQTGSAVRPFSGDAYLYDTAMFENDGRAGIVIGVRGGYLPDEVAMAVIKKDEGEPEEDIAPRALIDKWDTQSEKIVKDLAKAARAAMVEALAYEFAGSTDVLQALICSPEKEWIDDIEKFTRELVNFCWDKGKGVSSWYRPLSKVNSIRQALARAGVKLPSELDPEQEAALVLNYWYRERHWPDASGIAQARHSTTELLGKWPTDGDEQLQAELARALRDIEVRAKEKEIE